MKNDILESIICCSITSTKLRIVEEREYHYVVQWGNEFDLTIIEKTNVLFLQSEFLSKIKDNI